MKNASRLDQSQLCRILRDQNYSKEKSPNLAVTLLGCKEAIQKSTHSLEATKTAENKHTHKSEENEDITQFKFKNSAQVVTSNKEEIGTTRKISEKLLRGGGVKHEEKEKIPKKVKTIVEMFETFQRGNSSTRKSDFNAKNSPKRGRMSQIGKLKFQSKSGEDGLSEVMENINNKASPSLIAQKHFPKLKRINRTRSKFKLGQTNTIKSYFSPRRNTTNEKPEHDHMTNIQNYSQSEDSKKISDHSEDANKFRQSDPVLRDNSTTEEVPKN